MDPSLVDISVPTGMRGHLSGYRADPKQMTAFSLPRRRLISSPHPITKGITRSDFYTKNGCMVRPHLCLYTCRGRRVWQGAPVRASCSVKQCGATPYVRSLLLDGHSWHRDCCAITEFSPRARSDARLFLTTWAPKHCSLSAMRMLEK